MAHTFTDKEIVCSECSTLFTGKRRSKNARCETCRKSFEKIRLTQWYKQQHEDGKCQKCKGDRLDFSAFCMTHWCQSILRTSLGLRLPLLTHYSDILIERLRLQDFKCFYSSLPLTPGLNASIEHVKPRSFYPNLVDDLDNLVWVRVEINKMRSNLPISTFLDFCNACVTSPKLLELAHDEQLVRTVSVL